MGHIIVHVDIHIVVQVVVTHVLGQRKIQSVKDIPSPRGRKIIFVLAVNIGADALGILRAAVLITVPRPRVFRPERELRGGRKPAVVERLQQKILVPHPFFRGVGIENHRSGKSPARTVPTGFHVEAAAIGKRVVEVGLGVPCHDVGVRPMLMRANLPVFQDIRVVSVGARHLAVGRNHGVAAQKGSPSHGGRGQSE